MSTVGESIRKNPKIQAAFDTVVAEVEAATASITDVRPPSADLKVAYDELVEAAGQSRGRPLLYPYLGSGAGRGALVELADGSVKWDLVTGIGVHVLGHSHPAVVRASLEASLEDTTKHGNLQSGPIAYEFGKKLVALASKNSNLRHAFLTTSGAMANESALKVCMQKRHLEGHVADRVMAFEHCFMGRSLTMTSIGDSASARVGLPVNQPVDYLPFWDPVAAEAHGATAVIDGVLGRMQEYIDRYPGKHACLVMELVQGEGGFNVPPAEFLREVMTLARANGVPVWDDEIQSFGRTTEMFAYEHFGVGDLVDVFCVGKMTHACAAMFTEEFNPKPGLLSGTFTSGTTDFTVGLAVLETLEKGGFYGAEGRFAKHHAAFRTHAEALIAKHPQLFPEAEGTTELVGGTGGMMRLTPFGGAKEKIIAAAKGIYDEGGVVFWCGHGPFHLRLLPPVPVLELEDWPRIFEVLERGLLKAAG